MYVMLPKEGFAYPLNTRGLPRSDWRDAVVRGGLCVLSSFCPAVEEQPPFCAPELVTAEVWGGTSVLEMSGT